MVGDSQVGDSQPAWVYVMFHIESTDAKRIFAAFKEYLETVQIE
jgi:hypothetical protein